MEDGRNSATVVNYWILAGVAGVAPVITAEQLAERLARCAAHDDMFVSRLVTVPAQLGYPAWRRDEHMVIADRISVHLGGIEWPAAQDLLSEIGASVLDPRDGSWRAHILPDVGGVPGQTGRVSILAFHWHHAAFDGQRWAATLRGLLPDNTGPVPLPPPRRISADGPSRGAMALGSVVGVPRAVVHLVRALIARAPARAPAPAPTPVPRTRFNGPVRGRRRPELCVVEFADIAAIRRACPGATVNDVLLSVASRAVRLYLESVGEPPEGSLAALMPVAQPGSVSINAFTAVPVSVHSQAPDLATQVREIAASSAAAKAAATPEPALVQAIPAPVMWGMGVLSRWMLRRGPATPTASASFVLTNTNVRTPMGPVCGARVDVVTALLALSAPTTLAHSIWTVDGRVGLGITVDSAVMPDTTAYAECIAESIRQHVAYVADVEADPSG